MWVLERLSTEKKRGETQPPGYLKYFPSSSMSLAQTLQQVKEGTLTEQEALLRIPANQMDFFLHPTLDPTADKVSASSVYRR